MLNRLRTLKTLKTALQQQVRLVHRKTSPSVVSARTGRSASGDGKDGTNGRGDGAHSRGSRFTADSPLMGGPNGTYSELHFFSSGPSFASYPLRSQQNPHKVMLDKLTAIMKPREIREYLDRYVIGQSHAKKAIAVAVYNHYCRLRAVVQQRLAQHERALLRLSSDKLEESAVPAPARADEDEVVPEKSNILLIGPSGSGKTLLAKTISRLLKVPFAMGDATSLTEAGYVGEDVDSLLYRLLENAQFNEMRAQMGIVFLDEVDKIARAGGGAKGAPNSGGGRDIGGEGVQHALLKMLEGTTVQVVDRRKVGREYIQFDTSNLLFILSGAFVGLEGVVAGRSEACSIGFSKGDSVASVGSGQDDSSAVVNPAILGHNSASWTASLQTSDIISYGLIPEFIGRVPVLAVLEELDETTLVRTLTEPKNALIKQYQHLFRMNNVDLVFTKDALQAIGHAAVESKTGARGLRGILEKLLLPLMYDIPSKTEISRVIIGRDFVEGRADPVLEYAGAATTSSPP